MRLFACTAVFLIFTMPPSEDNAVSRSPSGRGQSEAAGSNPSWHHDYVNAQAEAKKANKPIFAVFL